MAERTWIVRSGADLGRAVGQIRQLRGLTQADLAREVGLQRPWLAKLETGHTTAVLGHLLRMLRRMGASIAVTITFEDERDDD